MRTLSQVLNWNLQINPHPYFIITTTTHCYNVKDESAELIATISKGAFAELLTNIMLSTALLIL